MRRREFEDWVRAERDGAAALHDLLALGGCERSWRRWIPRWFPVEGVRSVWLLDERPTAMARLRAALLAIPASALAGQSALWAWEMARTPRPLEVVASHDLRHRRVGGVRVTRSRTLVDGDVLPRGGWPTTSMERTILDVANRRGPGAARGLLIDALRRELTTREALADRLDLTPTAVGRQRVRAMLDDLAGVRPDSIFEWEVRRALVAAGLQPSPGPLDVPTPDGIFSCDLVLPEVRVAIECDGAHHLDAVQADRDVAKSNALAAAGWILLRVRWSTWSDGHEAFIRRVVSLARARTGDPSLARRTA